MFKLFKVSLFLFGILFLFSCTAQKMKYGTKTEFHDKADSLQSLARIKYIKSLDYSDFKAGKFDNGKVAVNYRFLKPKTIEKNKIDQCETHTHTHTPKIYGQEVTT